MPARTPMTSTAASARLDRRLSALTLRTARPIVRREPPVRESAKVSKAHRDRLPAMEYADRVTANTRAWDNHGTSRADARARLLDAVGVPA